MHVGSRGDLRNAEHGANFIEREAVLVAQHDGGALVRPKQGQRRLQRTTELLTLDRIGPRRRRRFVRSGGGRAGCRVNRSGRRTRTAHRVDGSVVRDPEEPAGQPSRRVERGEAAEGLDEGLLCEVLGLRAVACHARNEADNRPLIAADNLLEGRLRAGQRLDDEPGLAYRFQVNRDGPVLTRAYAEPSANVAADRDPRYKARRVRARRHQGFTVVRAHATEATDSRRDREYRDQRWRREATRLVETAFDAERFIEQVGFAACLTDSRRPRPSLYVAVCGRRDAVMPRHVQKDPEASLTWTLKDEIVRRGKVYYAKLARGNTMFLAPRMIPCFHALWGVRRSEEKRRLSGNAQAIVKVLRREWEIGTADLRDESGVKDRKAFTRGLDELQAAMIVVPSEVFYQPKFTYLWTLAVGRFPDALLRRVSREIALRDIARCFLAGAGMTFPGELARVTGLSRPDAGRGNRALVAEGYATMPAPGVYRLAASSRRSRQDEEGYRRALLLR